MARKPTHDERQLWKKVTSNTTPLNPVREIPVMDAAADGRATRDKTPKPPIDIKPFVIGSRAQTETAVHRVVKPDVPKMDARAFSKMKRGKLRPEATLDLHGMTVDRAHPALIQFVMNAHARGLRLILVITGKGQKNDGLGILRMSTPTWLKQTPLAQVILDVTQAHQRHGGAGAYYIYLRRNRDA